MKSTMNEEEYNGVDEMTEIVYKQCILLSKILKRPIVPKKKELEAILSNLGKVYSIGECIVTDYVWEKTRPEREKREKEK